MTDVTPIEGTYDPQLLTPMDRVRSLVGDVGPDFFIPDATYLAQLQLEQDWRLAAAAIADQLANMVTLEPNSFTATGDFSVAWGDRGAGWRRQAQQLRATVAAEAVTVTTRGVTSVLPTRGDDDMDPWEYTRPRR